MVTAADEVPDPEGFRLTGISRVSAPGIGGWTGGSDEVPVVCWVVESGAAELGTGGALKSRLWAGQNCISNVPPQGPLSLTMKLHVETTKS